MCYVLVISSCSICTMSLPSHIAYIYGALHIHTAETCLQAAFPWLIRKGGCGIRDQLRELFYSTTTLVSSYSTISSSHNPLQIVWTSAPPVCLRSGGTRGVTQEGPKSYSVSHKCQQVEAVMAAPSGKAACLIGALFLHAIASTGRWPGQPTTSRALSK